MTGRAVAASAGGLLLGLLTVVPAAGAPPAQSPPAWGVDPENVWLGPSGDPGNRRRLAWSIPESPPEVVAVHRSVRALGVASRTGPLTQLPGSGRASRVAVTPWNPSGRPLEQPLPPRSRILSVGAAPRGWWLLLGAPRRQFAVLHWRSPDVPPRLVVGAEALRGATPSRVLGLPDGRLVLADDQAGRLLWVEDGGVRPTRHLGASIHRTVLAREAGLVLVALGEDDVVALDPETGHEQWRWHAPEPLLWNLVTGPSLLWTTGTEGTLTGLDPRTGRPQFVRRAGSERILPSLGPRPPGFGVTVASLAVRVFTSRFPTVPWQALGPGQTLLVAWPDGTLEAYGADGERRWRVPARSEGLPPQAVLTDPQGRLLVLWADGTLTLHGPDGRQRWQVRPPRLLEVRPPFELLGGPDGWLAVAGRRGGLVTLRFPAAPRGPAR